MGGSTHLILVFIASCQGLDSRDLGAYLSQQEDILVVGEGWCLTKVLSSIRHARPDIVFLDVPAPDIGIELVSNVLKDLPETRVLIRCELCDPKTVSLILQRGVWGCLSTADPHTRCLKAIRAVMAGQMWASRDVVSRLARRFIETTLPQPQRPTGTCALTEREKEIVDSLVHGMTNKEIGKRLGISDETVKKHLKNIFGKLGIHRRAKLPSGRGSTHKPYLLVAKGHTERTNSGVNSQSWSYPKRNNWREGSERRLGLQSDGRDL